MKPAAFALLLGITVSAPSAEAITRARYLMGTVCEIDAPDSHEIDAAFDEASRIERMISTWRKDSELSQLNAAGDLAVSQNLYGLLHIAMQIAEETGGAFNPLVRPLIDLWQTRGRGSVPTPEAIADVLPRIALANVTFDRGTIHLANHAQFEEGGFGKGYALDRMLEKISARHLVVNFGGQLLVRGSERVTIADPRDRRLPLVSLVLRNASLSTSSGSEKAFKIDGVRFSHIIDPRTGIALPPGGSVSVISASGLAADALSTALYVMGRERGMTWCHLHSVTAIFISESGQVTTTSPIEGLTTLKESV